MSNPLVAITWPDDHEIPHVQKYLDVPLLVLDGRDILRGQACSFSFSKGKARISRKGQPIVGVRSVWYRGYSLVRGSELPIPVHTQRYAQDAIKYFNMMLFAHFEDAFWVSDFFAVERADDKFWQL